MAGDSFGERVRALRELAGLDQAELNRLAGLHRGHVWQIEEGNRENPTRETLSKLRAVLGVSLEYLAEGEGAIPDAAAVRAAVEAARVAMRGAA